MDATFIWFIILLVIGLVFLTISIFATDGNPRNNDLPVKSITRLACYIIFLLSAVIFILSIFTVVGTNKVGVMTEFGKPTTAHANGFHLKAPWAKKNEFDASRQFLRFEGAKDENRDDSEKRTYKCIVVRLDGNSTACLTGVVAWQMRATTDEEKRNAVQLFKDHKTFDRLTSNFVLSSTREALAGTFAEHNPLVAEKNFTIAQMNEKALSSLRAEFGSALNVLSIDLAVPDYDDKTDESIKNAQAEKAKTELAKQKELTNQAEARANAAISNSIKNDPGVLINKCLDIAKEQGKEPGYCMMQGSSTIIGPKAQ